jgi:hypothetical protein
MGAAQVMFAVAHSVPLALAARIVLGIGDALNMFSPGADRDCVRQ